MAQLQYRVSFPNANRHYVHVEIEIPKKLRSKVEDIHVKVPVWTPGSYKVREFSKNIDALSAEVGKKDCPVERSDKNTWVISKSDKGAMKISYDMYAFDYGVRESYVDDQMAFLHGVSSFAYIAGLEDEEIEISFEIPELWEVHTSLDPQSRKHSFSCTNYDLLADSPIALGEFETTEYESGGTPHKVVMIGKGNYDLNRIKTDFKRISDEQVQIFGGVHPSPRYVHFIQNTDNGGGGLEHLNSQTSQVNRFVYSDEKKYLKFLGLISHEYFHLWNVKRIRPVQLGPFNYNSEVYTDMLWIAEGITSYYDDLVLKRAGIHSEESYLAELAFNVNRLGNLKGKEHMTLAQSSKLAWVKSYLPNENSKNVTVSYYNKGMIVAFLLDQLIRESTQGNKKMDNLLLILYNKYYSKEGRGFTHDEFIKECSELVDFNLQYFFDDYIFGLKEIDYDKVMSYYGLVFSNKKQDKPYTGMTVKTEKDKQVVTYVEFDSPAEKSGISVGDEILAIDGWRLGSDINNDLSRYEAGQSLNITGARQGKIYTRTIETAVSPKVNYSISRDEESTEFQKLNYESWLN